MSGHLELIKCIENEFHTEQSTFQIVLVSPFKNARGCPNRQPLS
jgi:hypothetical protein